jgi:hypothetical protein
MSAFRATYSDLKLIKTRQCVQIVFELPIEQFDAAYAVLGGMPNPAIERWFGIAPLTTDAKPVKEKRDWRDLMASQQAGIRCNEPSFVAFLKEQRSDDWHEAPSSPDCIRLICGVESRSDLDSDHKARVIWHQLNDQFEAWKRVCA